jgi:hypothetical protein
LRAPLEERRLATVGVRLEGRKSKPLSRWLWLVKWVLLIPHFIILAFLLLGLILATIVAFVALLFTGSYPRRLFDYNLGVLRWTWRVSFYGYSALATDEYPPFTLGEAPGYPARLEIDYPDWQRRGLPLIGRWILGFPQYALAVLFAGSGVGLAEHYRVGGGVLHVLVFVVAMLLLFTDDYPTDVFDLVMGFNRWVFRVVAYALFMRPEYPPFRFDPGPGEPPRTADAEPPPVVPPVAG